MALKKITDLDAATTPEETGNLFEIAQDDGGGNFSSKKMSLAQLLALFPTLASGTYTPTFTILANLDSGSSYLCMYTRVGNVVTVWGTLLVDATASGNVRFYLSLPISSTFASTKDASGTAQGLFTSTSNVGWSVVYADIGNNRVLFNAQTNVLTNNQWFFSFSYLVL